MASAAPKINGTPINFGFTGVQDADGGQGILITGLAGTLLQSVEQSKVGECEKVRDGNGNDVVHAWSNIHDEATLEYIVTGSGLATAITNTTSALQTPGAILVISACASVPSLIGTTWEVQSGAKVSGSNTGAKKVTLPLHKLPGITAAAGA